MAQHGRIGITYSRKSYVFRKEHGASVERQNDELEAACRKDGLVAEHYSDATGHRSGKSAKNRPEYRKAIARILDPDVHTIYFDLLDRAWRNVEEWNRMIRICREQHVIIKLISQNIVISNEIDPFQKAFLDQMATFAEFESNVASYRQKKEVAHKKSLLIYWGSTPFGSIRVGKGLDAKMARNPPHDATVVRLAELYAAGESFQSIARQLNSEGFKHLDRQGHLVEVKMGAVQTIAWNVLFYSGYLVTERKWHAKHSKVKLEGEGTLLERYAQAMGAVRSPNIEPIISDELANRVIAARLSRRRTGRSLAEPRALLTPITFLSGNPHPLRAQFHNEHLVYRTRSKPSIVLEAAPLETAIRDYLKRFVFPLEAKILLRHEMLKRDGDEGRQRLRERSIALHGKLKRVQEMIEDGVYGRDEGMVRYRAIHQELTEVEQQAHSTNDVDALIATLESLGSVLDKIPLYRQKRVIQKIFTRIDVNTAGEIERLHPVPEARRAFGYLLGALERSYQQRPRQDLNVDLVSWQLLDPALAIPVENWPMQSADVLLS